jgi:hypothetical protein
MIRNVIASFAFAVATSMVAAASSPVQPGDQSRWSLDFRARMDQPSTQPIEVHFTGGWTSTISAVHAGEFDAQLQLANVQFAGDAVKGASPATIANLQSRLSRPFWATYRNDGGLLAIHFFRDVSPSDRNLLQMIATELQLVRPDSVRQSWTAQERDGAGEYSALYLMPRSDRITKRKLKYIYTDGIAGAPANALRVSIDQSDTTFSLTSDSRVQGIDGSDHVSISLSTEKSEQLAAITEFHASNLQTLRAPELAGSLERAHSDVIDLPIVTQKPDDSVARTESDDRLLKGRSTEDILKAAFAKDAGNAAQQDRLVALFRQRPEATAAAAALLIKDGPRRTVTNALGASNSLSAITALSGLAHDATLAKDLRVDAIVAFVQMQHPMAEAMRVPNDLVHDSNPAVQAAARMISGALARAGRPEHPTESEAIDASLLALYRNATDTRDKTELVGALGNSAGSSAIQAIKEGLRDSSSSIRSAAARALRLADGSDVDRLLARAILSDSDPAVRADAIFATRFRHPLASALADALVDAASADKISYVRSDALAVLRQNLAASVRIPEALARIADTDADAGIRRQAKDALATLPPPKSTRP